MKKLLIIFFASIIFSSASGQINKGKILINSSFLYSNKNIAQEDYTKMEINLVLGGNLMINEQFSIGVGVGYTREKHKEKINYNNNDTYTSTTFIPQFNICHYIPIANKIYYYTSLTIGIATTKEKLDGLDPYSNSIGYSYEDNDIGENKYISKTAALTPNLTYFISNHIALQCSFGGIFYATHEYKDIRELNISFLPSDWSFGFIVTLR